MIIVVDFVARRQATYHRKVYHSPYRSNTELVPLWYNPEMMNAQFEDVTTIETRLAPALAYLARRRMRWPALLLLSSHAPLAFVTGQALWLCSPFELLVPGAHLGDWARLLSHPQGGAALKRLVDHALADETAPRGAPADESL